MAEYAFIKDGTIINGKKQLKLRRKSWSTLFKKYQYLGNCSTTYFDFCDVNYKCFKKPAEKPKIKKRKKLINKKNIPVCTDENLEIDSGYNSDNSVGKEPVSVMTVSSTEDLQNKSTRSEHLNKLISFIEKDLKSDLKVMMTYRSTYKLLESSDYNYWHNMVKSEMKRLEKTISRSDLKEYLVYCHYGNILDCVNADAVYNKVVHEKKSTLKELLLKRDYYRDNRSKYLKYSRMIWDEWYRLSEEDVPTDYLLLYGFNVMSLIDKAKDKTCSPSVDF